MNGELIVLWEDPHGLAVAKPSGMLTQGPIDGEVTLETLVRRHLRPDDPASVYLGTVHRLDRPVSGVVLWAKTPKAARRWAGQFAGRSARKEYWAIVEGHPERLKGVGIWDDFLGRPDALGRAPVVDAGTPGAVRALTSFELGEGRGVAEGLAWLKLWPETGRTHQLRAQSAARGTPIVGGLPLWRFPTLPRWDRPPREVIDRGAPGRPTADRHRGAIAWPLGGLVEMTGISRR